MLTFALIIGKLDKHNSDNEYIIVTKLYNLLLYLQ